MNFFEEEILSERGIDSVCEFLDLKITPFSCPLCFNQKTGKRCYYVHAFMHTNKKSKTIPSYESVVTVFLYSNTGVYEIFAASLSMFANE